ncbi:MAG TPA: AsmA family protein, partial [Chthoniobacteraceae bacterium]
MHRLSKAILIILFGLIVLAGLAVVGVNLYIQSPSTQAEIQAALAKATGLPLQITSTTVTPWGGLHMSGISVPAEGGTQLGAKSFHANCRYLELMHGRYIFNEVTLDSPRFVWVQGSDGQWKLPLLPETKVKKAPAVTPSEPRAPKPKAPPISVDALAITNGSLELIDSEKKQVLLVSDLQISASLPDPDKAGGSISLGRITCQNAVNFNNVHAAWHFQDGKLSLTDLASSVAGGAVSGNATVQAVGKANPFQITLHLDHVDLAKIITEAKVKGGEASGLISLELTLQGDAQKFDEATGKGRLTASALQLGQIDSAAAVTATLQDIGALMQISELADLRFDTGESDFHIKDQHAYIDHLLLAAPNIQVSSKGNFRFDGRISFDARLSVSQKLWSRLP